MLGTMFGVELGQVSGEDLMNMYPPSVESWHTGSEWIDGGVDGGNVK